MDYYYALLDNYKLLRQRRFKLSLREEEAEGMSEEDKIRAVISTAGEAKFEAPATWPEGNIKLYKSDTGSIMATDNEKGSTGQVQWAGVVDKYGKRGQSGFAKKYWRLMFPSEAKKSKPTSNTEDEGGEGGEGGEGEGGQEVLEAPGPAAAERAAVVLSKALEDDNQRALATADSAHRKISEQDIDTELEKMRDLAELTAEVTDIDERTIVVTLEGVTEFLKLGMDIQNHPEKAANGDYTHDINNLIQKYDISVDQYGCIRFGGTAIGACTASESLIQTKMRDHLLAIRTTIDSDRAERGIGSESIAIPEISIDEEGPVYTMAGEDRRGTAVENLDTYSRRLDDCIEGAAEKEDWGCLDEFGDGVLEDWESGLWSADALLRSLAVGYLAMDSAILTQEGEIQAVAIYNFLMERLVAEGAKPEDAEAFLKKAAGIGDDGKIKTDDNGNPVNADRLKAILAVIIGNRHFAEGIAPTGMPPDFTIGAGQGQLGASNVLGAKQDLLDIYCVEGDVKEEGVGEEKRIKLREYAKGLMNDEQTDFLRKECGKYPSEDDDGFTGPDTYLDKYIDDNLIREIDNETLQGYGADCGENATAFAISREPKVHSPAQGERVQSSTMGDIGSTKLPAVMEYICRDEDKEYVGTLSETETEHIDNIKKLFGECADSGESLGKEAFSGACKIYKKIIKSTKPLIETLTPGTLAKGPDGQMIEAGLATIDLWEDAISGAKKERLKREGAGSSLNEHQERRAGAIRALKGEDPIPPATIESDAEHLEKIRTAIRDSGVKQVLMASKERNSQDGTLTGDAKSYAQVMYALGALAHQDVINEKRDLTHNRHYAGARNAEVIRNVQTATFVHQGGSAIYVNQGDDQRALIKRDRGNTKVQTGSSETLYKLISDRDTAEEGRQGEAKKRAEAQKKEDKKNLTPAEFTKKYADLEKRAKEEAARRKELVAQEKEDREPLRAAFSKNKKAEEKVKKEEARVETEAAKADKEAAKATRAEEEVKKAKKARTAARTRATNAETEAKQATKKNKEVAKNAAEMARAAATKAEEAVKAAEAKAVKYRAVADRAKATEKKRVERAEAAKEERVKKAEAERDAAAAELKKVRELTPEQLKEKAAADRKAKKAREEAIKTLGPSFHEKWAEKFREENPNDEDRFKPTTDKKWAKENEPEDGWGDEGPQVDILNTNFKDLPKDAQKENTNAAKAAVDSVEVAGTEEEAAEAVHEAWMKRNRRKKKKNPELFVPYAELSQEEKDKDLYQVRAAAKALGKKWGEPKEESLLIAFLRGQQILLEKLMDKTT